MNCSWCGWGDQIKPSCKTGTQAEACDLNRENVRKYRLRFPHEAVPNIVLSTRYQDPNKSKWGTYYEFLERVE